MRFLACAALSLFVAACAETAEPGRFGRHAALIERILEAEDARAATENALAPIFEGLSADHAEVRRIAVRALGRMERDALVPRISPLLDDTVTAVRAEAANALAQAAHNGDATAARGALEARAEIEIHARVIGVLAESLGRLPHASADAAAATALRLAALAPATRAPSGALDSAGTGDPIDLDRGVARGLFFLARQPAARGALPEAALDRLRALARRRDEGTDTLHARRVRTASAAALIASGSADSADIAALLDDAHPLVRREAAAALVTSGVTGWRALAARAWADSSTMVRYAVLRAFAREPGPAACTRARGAVRDPGPHVALLAIDLIAQLCARSAAPLLDSIAGTLPAEPVGWHTPAHALASLAALDADRAGQRLPAFVTHANFFVRTWAARAAATLGDTEALFTLATDLHPNVRTEAISGLARHAEHAADAVYIAQLSESDSQLLQAAAGALEGTTSAAARPALLDALDRVTTLRHETLRDARAALLERIAELGTVADTARLQPYLRDHDPVIAARAADILGAWTGARHEPAPQPLARAPMPALDELERLAGARAILEMATGDSVVLALLPFAAPTNTARFVRLARAGYFDGLSFHRIAPNFVVQGGSPNANEYAGDGPYTRDELVIEANWRGAVGLSTRGRDTGDAQLYVNLIDNIRLDHDYTVFAVVLRGTEAVDAFLEGEVIRTIRIR
ncbi:MAG: peptidylprolyl isomerase [Gemmatimonadetes bacterium]|nr:peptidylprolyl isomerase [Gemmatimonadota bacterium]